MESGREEGTEMGLARAAHCCVVMGGLAAVFYAALGNPDRDLKAALARLDARPTLASSHAALVAPDLSAVLSSSDADNPVFIPRGGHVITVNSKARTR